MTPTPSAKPKITASGACCRISGNSSPVTAAKTTPAEACWIALRA
jgi:hypothetical protein